MDPKLTVATKKRDGYLPRIHIGSSGSTFQWIAVGPPPKRVRVSLTLNDIHSDLESSQFFDRFETKTDPRTIIPHYHFLVEGNMRAVKLYTINQCLGFRYGQPSEEHPITMMNIYEKILRDCDDFKNDRIPEPLTANRVSESSILVDPSAMAPSFVFKAALVANLDIPPTLEKSITRFIFKHPSNQISPNGILHALMLYNDIYNISPDRMAEDWSKASDIPKVPVGAFVLGYPVWLISHQEYNLAFFSHPSRFMEEKRLFDGEQEEWLSDKMLAVLIKKIKPHVPNVPVSTRIPLIPPYMPGSKVKMPPRWGMYSKLSPVQEMLLAHPKLVSFEWVPPE